MFVGIIEIISENVMKEKIKAMLETDKLKLVKIILINIRANQLFEPEGNKAIHPESSTMENKLLNNRLNQDKDVLEIEYEHYTKTKENSNKKITDSPGETDMKVEDNGWTQMLRQR